MQSLPASRSLRPTLSWELPIERPPLDVASEVPSKLTGEFASHVREISTPPLTPRALSASSPRPHLVEDDLQQDFKLIISLGTHLENVGKALSAYGAIQGDARSGANVLQPGTLQAVRGTLAALISGHGNDSYHPRPPHIGTREVVESAYTTMGSRQPQDREPQERESTDAKLPVASCKSRNTVTRVQTAIQSDASSNLISLTSWKQDALDIKHLGSGEPVGSLWKQWRQRSLSRSLGLGVTKSNSRKSAVSTAHSLQLHIPEENASEASGSSNRSAGGRDDQVITQSSVMEGTGIEAGPSTKVGIENGPSTNSVPDGGMDSQLQRSAYESSNEGGASDSVGSPSIFAAPNRTAAKLAALAFGDSFVALVIIAYAAVLGVSADVKWYGWQAIEYCFTVFFILELLVKMIGLGFGTFFCGPDKSWNLCDTVIVSIAVLDSSLYLLLFDESDTEFSNLYIVRAVRLCRLARLVRLLRFSMFAELKTMISGIISGLKVLLWAIILFFVLLYVSAIMLRQLLDPGFAEVNADPEIMKAFSSMASSINTLFMCFTGECTASDGSPLQVRMFDRQGFYFIVCCMLVMLFVSIGLFNLIMATFVDNVLEKGRQRKMEQRALVSRRLEKRLRHLVKTFCRSGGGLGERFSLPQQSSQSLSDRGKSFFLRWLGKSEFESSVMNIAKNSSKDSSKAPDETLSRLLITRERFRDLLSEPLFEETMIQLDIETSSHDELFDVLDADMSGELDLDELIMGLMSLRGPAEKKDVVGSLLCIRATQAYLREGHDKIRTYLDHVLTELQTHTNAIRMQIEGLQYDLSRG